MSYKILKVEVSGFKSHMHSTFEYSPGLTVVTGPSDAGKSAGVMQPIKWVAFGEPAGENFLFTLHDENTKEVIFQVDGASVEITMENGTTIAKTRRKGKTAWYLNGELISEKADVPEEVTAALGFTKQAYGDFETSLNFAYQLEAPFILSETPSVGAKALGKLAGTEVVDKAIGSISKKVYQARSDKAAAQKTIDQSNVGLVEYLDLDETIKAVEDSERLITKLDEDAGDAAHIRQLIGRFDATMEQEARVLTRLKLFETLPYAKQIMDAVEVDLRIADVVYPAYIKYNELEEQVGQTNSKLRQLEVLPTVKVLMEEVATAYTTHTAIFANAILYSSLEDRIRGKMEALDSLAHVFEASELLAEIDKQHIRGNNIASLMMPYNNAVSSICRAEGTLEACRKLPEVNKLLAQIDEEYKRLEEIKALCILYNSKDKGRDIAILNVDTKAEERKAAEEELAAAWEEAGGKCPLCDSPVVHTH